MRKSQMTAHSEPAASCLDVILEIKIRSWLACGHTDTIASIKEQQDAAIASGNFKMLRSMSLDQQAVAAVKEGSH